MHDEELTRRDTTASTGAGGGPRARERRVFVVERGGHPLADYGGYGAGDISFSSHPGLTVNGLSYAYPSIGAVISGGFDYVAAKGSVSAHPGVVIFGNHGEEFSFTYQAAENLRRVVIAFDPDLVLETAEALGSRPEFPKAGIDCGPRQIKLYGALRRLACLKQPRDDLALGALILALGETTSAEATISEAQRGTLRAIARHLTDTCTEPWDLAGMARLAGMSRYHFIRRFSSAVGETPRQHLIGARLRLAADQLTDGAQQVTSIALNVGFNDISHFNHTFLRTFGCSPRSWLSDRKAASAPPSRNRPGKTRT